MGALQLSQIDSEQWFEPLVPVVEPAPQVPVRPTRAPAAPVRRLSLAQALRRRRLLALVAASAVLLGAVAVGRALVSAESSTPELEPVALVDEGVYVVEPGDTLWTIARRLAPEEDPRPVVDQLRSAHGDVELQVGDRLDLGDLTQ